MAGEIGPEGWSELYDVPGSSIDIPASPDYLPSLLSEWQKEKGWLANLKPVGQRLQSANTGISTLGNLVQSWYSSEEEKAAS